MKGRSRPFAVRRSPVPLALGVGVPTLLLGLGWFVASLRAQEGEATKAQDELIRVAETVRAAVDESLEELRRREDARPFYLYNHYYSPPDVLAVSDPVAVSPLAVAPADERVLGYFQLERSGHLRTPYDPPPPVGANALEGGREQMEVAPDEATLDEATLQRDARLRTWVESSGVAQSLGYSLGYSFGHADGQEGTMGILNEPALAYRAPEEPARGRSTRLASIERPAGERASNGTPRAARGDRGNATPLDNTAMPEGPLTTNLAVWNNFVAEDIQLAQSGSFDAQVRVQQRGRSAPLMNRRDVSASLEGNHEGEEPRSGATQRAPDDGVAAEGSSRSNRRPPNRARRDSDSAPAAPPVPSLMPMQQQTAEIEYTPMQWWRDEERVLLYREVSHQGVSVLQGVALESGEARRAWVQRLVARHTPPANRPAVVPAGDETSCALRHPLSEVLPLELCFATVPRADSSMGFYLQLGMLLGLLILVFLALWAIVRATDRANRLAAQQGEFVAAVSHELRTPLTTIRMHAEMLDEGIVSEERAPRVHAELVGESARLSRLIENVLEASRLGADQRRLLCEDACLATHVRRTGERQRSSVERKLSEGEGPKLEIDVPDQPMIMSFDGQAVEQIVVNLLDNATKYAADSKAISLRVEADSDGRMARVIVADRGPGIPQDQREAVFERFFRVEREGEGHAPGTGIGLALVRELAELHGGHAWAVARDGGGLEVIVALPM